MLKLWDWLFKKKVEIWTAKKKTADKKAANSKEQLYVVLLKTYPFLLFNSFHFVLLKFVVKVEDFADRILKVWSLFDSLQKYG